MEKEKKLSAFQIACAILIGVLIVIIAIQFAVIWARKKQLDDLQNKLDELPPESEETPDTSNSEDISIEQIDELNYKIIIQES